MKISVDMLTVRRGAEEIEFELHIDSKRRRELDGSQSYAAQFIRAEKEEAERENAFIGDTGEVACKVLLTMILGLSTKSALTQANQAKADIGRL